MVFKVASRDIAILLLLQKLGIIINQICILSNSFACRDILYNIPFKFVFLICIQNIKHQSDIGIVLNQGNWQKVSRELNQSMKGDFCIYNTVCDFYLKNVISNFHCKEVKTDLHLFAFYQVRIKYILTLLSVGGHICPP